LILSIIWRLDPHFPDNAAFLKAVPVCTMLCWLALCYWFARRYGKLPANAALWILFFVAANQWSLIEVGALMSDTLFAALLLATVAVLMEADQRGSVLWAAVAGLLAAAAFHTRTAGLPIAGAGVLALAFRKRFRQAAVFGGIVIVFIGGWIVWQRQAVDLGNSLENYYTAKDYAALNLMGSHLPFSVHRYIFFKNLYLLAAYPARCVFSFLIPFSLSQALFGLLLWGVMARGFWKAPGFFLPARVLIAIYPIMTTLLMWEPSRYWLPLLPILLVFAYFGLPARTPVWAVPALAIMPLLVAFTIARYTRQTLVPAWPLSSLAARRAVQWSKFSQLQEWIRDHAAPKGVVLAFFDFATYLYSGHQSIRPFIVNDAEFFHGFHGDNNDKIRICLEVIRKYNVMYLIETGDEGAPPEREAYARIRDYLLSAGRIRLLKELAPQYRIFEILSPPSAAQDAVRTERP
jgi:hypothetical protein